MFIFGVRRALFLKNECARQDTSAEATREDSRRVFPSTFLLSPCLGFPRRECTAGIRITANLLEIGKNYSNRLIYNFPHVSSKFSQNFLSCVNFLKIPDFYFLILFPKCRKKFIRILYFKVFLKFH